MTSYHRWAGSPAGMIQLHGYTKASAQELADWKVAEAKKDAVIDNTFDWYDEFALLHGVSRGEVKARLWAELYGGPKTGKLATPVSPTGRNLHGFAADFLVVDDVYEKIDQDTWTKIGDAAKKHVKRIEEEAFKALFQNDPKVGDPSDFSSIEARALAHFASDPKPGLTIDFSKMRSKGQRLNPKILERPSFSCDTCKDTGKHMGAVCYGGPPIETTVHCIDCGPEKYRGRAVD
jgi:hypothetical protein